MKKVVYLIFTFALLLIALPAMAVNYHGPGLVKAPLITQTLESIGEVSVWNTRGGFHVHVDPAESMQIQNLQIYVGNEPAPATKKFKLIPGKFNYKVEDPAPGDYVLNLDLEGDLGFQWGEPYEELRVQNVAVHVSMIKLGEDGEVVPGGGAAWAYTGAGTSIVMGDYDEAFLDDYEGVGVGWSFSYELSHPRRGHFIDSPVGGLSFSTPTHSGLTDESGAFDFFPGEIVSLSIGHYPIGSTVAAHKISPLDFLPLSDIDDVRVINMARLLQSLDSDAYPKSGITIIPDVVTAFEAAMNGLGLDFLDFSNSDEINSIILATIDQALAEFELVLVAVSAEDARDHLDDTLNNVMFRKNISKTPELGSSKAKLNVMGVWFPALRANGEPTTIEYYDENGALLRTSEEAKPLAITYTDADPVTGAHDTWAAISRDDGHTWKRKNLSRAADRSSMAVVLDGVTYDYPGATKKPVFQVKGNNILVAWSSKFCKGGKPAYAIDIEDEYTFDDPYYVDDIFGVAGPQRSHDYTEDGFPEVGELPYSCVWAARGTIVNQGMINSGGFWTGKANGDIVWFKPERLTSGRRDALQIFMGGADGAGFAIAFQEDPSGLRPGKFAGPGHGWSGATTNHKTDIWYSFITMANFRKIDEDFVIGGDPEHDLDVSNRPKALVPMSLPVRVSDNDTVNTDNLLVELGENGYPTLDGDGNWTPIPNYDADSEGDGTHRYGYEIEGLCEGFYEFYNYNNELKKVCFTEDGRLLDGDTGASRANLFLQTYTKPDGTKSAWAIMNYEETKGAGIGPPDHLVDPPYGDEPLPEEGKNVIYHSFDFQNPDLVSAGGIVNLPERDAEGNLMYLRDVTLDGDGNLVYGDLRLDYLDQPQLAYENSRRARFILQGKAAIGASKTVMLIVYKEGREGMGRPSDIMLRRVVSDTAGNPYRFDNVVCDAWELADNGLTVCVDGTQNMSTVLPTVTTDSQGDPTSDDPWGAVKVVEWEQTEALLADASWVNPYEDARAHRGQIRGDLVTMGYSYTANWAAARNGNDKYDFHVRRSFDGGQTWTTDPAGEGVTHCQTWTDPLTKEKTEVCNTYAAGSFEQARNLSQLPNSKTSVIEPRIVCPPGTIKDPATALWTGIPEDKQNKAVCYVAFGTSTNPKKDPVTQEQEHSVPMDLYYSFTQDKGESYVEVAWDVNPDSDGNFPGETVYRWDYLAKGDPEQGEVQLRMTPDGSRFYSCWLDEGEEGSDIVFRRIMSPAFPANILP